MGAAGTSRESDRLICIRCVSIERPAVGPRRDERGTVRVLAHD